MFGIGIFGLAFGMFCAYVIIVILCTPLRRDYEIYARGVASRADLIDLGSDLPAAVLVAEAGGEGEDGLCAVAEVIAERRRQILSQRPSATAFDVVTRPGAFSCLNNEARYNPLIKRHLNHPRYKEARELVRLIDAGKLPSEFTKKADHFCHKDIRPKWALGLKPTAVIENHAFYRLGRH